MNLTLSKRGDYVVRSALCLARAYESGEQRKIREVVAEMGVPQNYASQILAELVRGGLATSRAGRDGGYRLSRAPESISLLEVVEAGEGPLRPDRCALGDGPCRWEGVCPLHATWSAATEALRKVLADATLAEVQKQDLALEEGSAVRPADSHRTVHTNIQVEDWVHIERGADAIVERLQHDGWIAHHLGEAYGEAESLRSHIDPESSPWRATSAAAVRLGPPSTRPDGATHLALSWQVSLAGGADSRLEGQVELRSIDRDRTELHLVGRFRPPARPGPAAEPDPKADRLTRATVRSFLRRVASAIEVP
ncbi:MAG TPA: Rrf2 family transcriptional regulator [Acidimicrobiales bacterium]|nr:Rrf2 family transcriptional regulator [Acidimicrobiales bacterium]